MRSGLRKRCGCGRRKWDGCPHDWELRIKLAGLKRQRLTFRAKSRDEAVAFAMAERLKLRTPLADRVTVKEAAKSFLAAHPGRPRYHVDMLSGAFAPKLLHEVSAGDIETLAIERQQKAAKGRHGGVDARRHLLATARRFWNWCIKQKLTRATPFRENGVSMIDVPTSRQRHRRLVGDEEQRLLESADAWTKDLITAALETGCRGGELRALQWRDVQDGVLVLQADKTKTKRMRRIPISPTLDKILERRRKGPDAQNLPADAHVFGNETGEQVSRRAAHRSWAATLKTAKIDDLKFHDLRHEFGSQLLEAGGKLHEVQATLGHTNIRMTSTYLNAQEAGIQDAFAKLAAKRRRKNLRVVGR
jgi:integrase